MRHYGMGYQEVMELPLQAFWMLNRNIVRLMAEEDQRAVTTGFVAQVNDYEHVKRFQETLALEIGQVTVVEDGLDREGLDALKATMRPL